MGINTENMTSVEDILKEIEKVKTEIINGKIDEKEKKQANEALKKIDQTNLSQSEKYALKHLTLVLQSKDPTTPKIEAHLKTANLLMKTGQLKNPQNRRGRSRSTEEKATQELIEGWSESEKIISTTKSDERKKAYKKSSEILTSTLKTRMKEMKPEDAFKAYSLWATKSLEDERASMTFITKLGTEYMNIYLELSETISQTPIPEEETKSPREIELHYAQREKQLSKMRDEIAKRIIKFMDRQTELEVEILDWNKNAERVKLLGLGFAPEVGAGIAVATAGAGKVIEAATKGLSSLALLYIAHKKYKPEKKKAYVDGAIAGWETTEDNISKKLTGLKSDKNTKVNIALGDQQVTVAEQIKTEIQRMQESQQQSNPSSKAEGGERKPMATKTNVSPSKLNPQLQTERFGGSRQEAIREEKFTQTEAGYKNVQEVNPIEEFDREIASKEGKKKRNAREQKNTKEGSEVIAANPKVGNYRYVFQGGGRVHSRKK